MGDLPAAPDGSTRDGGRVGREHALRRAVLAGDERAWRAWYDEAAPGLDRYVRWRCGGLPDLADDVLQETWLTAVRRVRRFDPERAAFAAWLAGIAANVIRNRLRQRRRQADRGRPVVGEPTAPSELPADDGERVVRALAELPEHYEAVLRAKYLDQRCVAAIAAARGETPKAVESLLTRARDAFRNAYQAQEDFS